MKDKLISAIKLIVPLAFGVFLIWLFYDALCEDQKEDLFLAFKKANYVWVFIAMCLGYISHLSRAWRWRYLLDSMGYKVKYWNAYHAVFIGYIINYILPRAGEVSRAGVLAQTEKVPFKKGFGSIIAERAIDVGMLGIICGIALVMQFDMIPTFQMKIDSFTSGNFGCGNSSAFSILGNLVKYGIILGVIGIVVISIVSRNFRLKVIDFVKGVWEGAISIFKTEKKLLYIMHTVIIWVMYVAMFAVVFFSVDSTATLGIDAWLAGFIAGTIGLIIVQGGIGVYPAFVGLIITTYLNPNASGILPDALALGWIIWASQTGMMIVLGLISLMVNSKNVKLAKHEASANTTE